MARRAILRQMPVGKIKKKKNANSKSKHTQKDEKTPPELKESAVSDVIVEEIKDSVPDHIEELTQEPTSECDEDAVATPAPVKVAIEKKSSSRKRRAKPATTSSRRRKKTTKSSKEE